MHEEMIPIILFLVTGIVLVVYFYFRSKDRQLIIEKGMSPEIVNNLFRFRWNPYIWLKVGVVTACGSLGILLGNFLMWAFPDRWWSEANNTMMTSSNETMMAFSILFMIGVGFIAAFYLSRKMEREEEERENKIQ